MGVHTSSFKHCKTCDFTYDTRCADEVARHKQLHPVKRRAWEILSYRPWSAKERHQARLEAER
jgi:hypothetical protein